MKWKQWFDNLMKIFPKNNSGRNDEMDLIAIRTHLREEIAQMKTQSGHYANDAYRLMLAEIGSDVANRLYGIELALKAELKVLNSKYQNVSYQLTPGDHGETVCLITVSDSNPDNIHTEDLFWYIFPDKDKNLISFVSKTDVLKDKGPGDVSEYMDIITRAYEETSSKHLRTDVHNIMVSILDDVENENWS